MDHLVDEVSLCMVVRYQNFHVKKFSLGVAVKHKEFISIFDCKHIIRISYACLYLLSYFVTKITTLPHVSNNLLLTLGKIQNIIYCRWRTEEELY